MKTVLALALVILAGTASAKGYSPAVTTAPGGYDIKFASNGTTLAVPLTQSGQGVGMFSTSKVNLPNGQVFEVAASAAIAVGAIGGPWAAAAAAVGTVAIFALPAFVDAYARAGARVNNGNLEMTDPSVCTVAPCAAYIGFGNHANKTFSTISQACTVSLAGLGYQFLGTSGVGCLYNRGFGQERAGLQQTTVAPSPPSYIPATTNSIAQRLNLETPTTAQVQALVDLNFPPVPSLPIITGPSSVFKGNTVELGLDGTVKEIEERYIASYSPGHINIGLEKKQTITAPGKQSTTTTTNPDGSQSTAVTTSPGITATVTTTTETDPSSITCGLPGTPPCAISEAGVPGQPEVDAAMKSKPSDVQKDIDDLVKNPSSFFPPFPTLNWAFALPTGCAQIPTPAFAPAMTSIDVCQFQPMFHDLMTVVWMLGGLFGAISLFMKNALSH